MGQQKTLTISKLSSDTIEWLRFVCATFVVFIHASGGDAKSYDNSFYDFLRIFLSEGICLVAVPSFFLISGYLFFQKLDNYNIGKYKQKIKNRLKTLLVPYIIWNILAYVVFVLTNITHGIGMNESWGRVSYGSLWNAHGGLPFNNPLWFVRDLMVLCLLAPLIYFAIKKGRYYVLFALGVLYFNIWFKLPGFSIKSLLFFSIGAFLSIERIDFVLPFRKNYLYTLIVALPCLIGMTFLYERDMLLWNYFQRIFTILGTVSFIGMASVLMEKKKIKAHSLLSDCSFFIYVTHGMIIMPKIAWIIRHLVPSETQLALIAKYLIIPMITVLFIVFVYYIMCKYLLRQWQF